MYMPFFNLQSTRLPTLQYEFWLNEFTENVWYKIASTTQKISCGMIIFKNESKQRNSTLFVMKSQHYLFCYYNNDTLQSLIQRKS